MIASHKNRRKSVAESGPATALTPGNGFRGCYCFLNKLSIELQAMKDDFTMRVIGKFLEEFLVESNN